ncbi:restriction endonuclease [Alteromonas macleodii]|uniref:restriction endonuclease n=1 Tax=Alteromonas macleodii TaxID=28108 RepID=UPI002076B5BD|nr:restriction endonuclease [Alteromonas macleodii]USI28721.1 restriction endonuclease [Alteromonas macleodii]
MISWKKYERFVAELCSEDYQSANTTIIPNAKIKGCLSKTSRQVDVLIDSRFGDDRNRRIIVDAKKYSRPLNVKDVESFYGMMIDCSSKVGVLVCPNGYSAAAKKRAQDFINLKIVSLQELEDIDLKSWDDCLSDNCDERSERGLVLWDVPMGIGSPASPVSISCIGKCDVCGDFHIWCWGCGKKFSLSDESDAQCDCEHHWFWLTAIEDDDISSNVHEQSVSVYLLLVTPSNALFVDRKPLN